MKDTTYIQIKSLPITLYKKLQADCVVRGLKLGRKKITYAEWIEQKLAEKYYEKNKN